MTLNTNRWIEGFSWRNNIYSALFQQLALSMALLTICRVGFFFFNKSFFPEVNAGDLIVLLGGGLVFDLTTMLYVNMLFILLMTLPLKIRFNASYKATVRLLYFITNGAALAANVADFIYYRFTLRRTTADVFLQFKNETNMTGLWFKFFMDYWYAVLFWVMLILLMIFVFNRIRYKGPQLKSSLAFYIGGTFAVPIIAYLIIGGIRGGFRHSTRPITLSNAGEYVKDPKHVSIVLNTPFAIIRTLGKTKVKRVDYYSKDEVEKIYSPVHIPQPAAEFVDKNVVVIILESFSREFFGFYNRDKNNGTYTGYTPFLDSLLTHSKTFQYSFANGRKSIDGLPSVVSSIPSLGVPYFLSPYSGNRINSFASLLKEKGYHTAFFHGAPNGSMGFQAFMNIAGVEEYYGMSEYANDDDFDGLWGIWDEKFLQFYADKMNTFKEPFFTAFFSVSSHHPFKIPPEYEGKFKGGPLVIHKCVQYTDYSLKKFFEKASAMPWYKNTIFVITADHTSSEIEFPESRTAAGLYTIPIIFFSPDNTLQGVEPSISQQIDILPTTLGLLHYDKPYLAYGRDALSPNTTGFCFNYKDNTYQLFQGDFLLQFDGTKSLALYNFKTDKLLETNLVKEKSEVVAQMETVLKAIIQQYNNRMIEDRLTVKN